METLDPLELKMKTREELRIDHECDSSTITRIVQQEQNIISIALENGNTARQRLHKRKHDDLERAAEEIPDEVCQPRNDRNEEALEQAIPLHLVARIRCPLLPSPVLILRIKMLTSEQGERPRGSTL
uniref:Uncharacterized protein n=1 Tax=Plectus sambesii TaxID=2011161 RepID=A0A914XN28_9BILA